MWTLCRAVIVKVGALWLVAGIGFVATCNAGYCGYLSFLVPIAGLLFFPLWILCSMVGGCIIAEVPTGITWFVIVLDLALLSVLWVVVIAAGVVLIHNALHQLTRR